MNIGKTVLKKQQDAQNYLSKMNDEQFDHWADLLKERTGMDLPVERKSFLETSISLRMQEVGANSYAEYLQILATGVNGEIEWKYLIDRLTVHETRFFRHPASLAFIRDYIAKKPTDFKTGNLTVQVWSAGCSTGEEPYSLAITLDQALKNRAEVSYFGITATDISVPAIQVGRRGIYGKRRLRDVDQQLKEQYFEKMENEQFRVKSSLKKRVCFSPMNILDTANNKLGMMDIIYCQNLLIYFDKGRRFQIVDSLVEHLNPGGLLILGSGELLNWGHPVMRKLDIQDTLAYQYMGPKSE